MKAFLVWKPFLIGVSLFFFALGLRLVANTISPPSPYWEEVALGYDAYSLWQTGKDHQGNPFPVVAFPSFGDYKPSLYFYATAPSVGVLGLTPFAVRLPAAVASALTVWCLYSLARRWSSERAAVWTGFLLAIQPWAWFLGRVGFETNLATFLLCAGVFCLDSAFRFRRQFFFWSALAALTFALSTYAYHSARLLAPLFATTTWLFLFPWPQRALSKKALSAVLTGILAWLPAFLLALALLFPLLKEITQPSVQQRVAETSLFSDPTLRQTIAENHITNTGLERVLENRRVIWTFALLRSYLSHFDPAFLFAQGEVNHRHSPRYFQMLYPWEFLTIILGLASGALFMKKKKYFWLLITLALLSPLAAMVTKATPHALRSQPLSLWLAFLSALGITSVLSSLAARARWKHVSGFLLWSLFFCASTAQLIFLVTQYPKRYSHEWQYGYQQVIQALRRHQQPNEKLFLTREQGRPAMYVLFMEQVDPRQVQLEFASLPKDQGELLAWREWTFYDSEPSEPGLYAQSFSKHAGSAEPLETIFDLAGKPRWVIIRK